MAKSDELAADVRRRLQAAGVLTFNLVSSPGTGKTMLLERTLADLGGEIAISVVTGDVQTQNDADRLARHTDRLVQAVVTNGACHLDARQVATALDEVDLTRTRLLFIENVGNLVCPAGWDLGEDAKIVVFSVTEGEDKPVKYPNIFRQARYVVLSKMDLLPHVPFSVEKAVDFARQVNPTSSFCLRRRSPGGMRSGTGSCARWSAGDDPSLIATARDAALLRVTGVVQGWVSPVRPPPAVRCAGWVLNAAGTCRSSRRITGSHACSLPRSGLRHRLAAIEHLSRCPSTVGSR